MTCIPEPVITRAGWFCPGCRTYYSPDVQECRCETRPRSLADRLKPEPPIHLGGATIKFPQFPEVVAE